MQFGPPPPWRSSNASLVPLAQDGHQPAGGLLAVVPLVGINEDRITCARTMPSGTWPARATRTALDRLLRTC